VAPDDLPVWALRPSPIARDPINDAQPSPLLVGSGIAKDWFARTTVDHFDPEVSDCIVVFDLDHESALGVANRVGDEFGDNESGHLEARWCDFGPKRLFGETASSPNRFGLRRKPVGAICGFRHFVTSVDLLQSQEVLSRGAIRVNGGN
jgi:hypothetical protein